MNGIVGFRWEKVGQDFVRLLSTSVPGTQADAAAHPMDMRINGKCMHIKRKLHDDRGCLGADSVQSHQPRVHIIRRHLSEEVELDLAAFLGNRP